MNCMYSGLLLFVMVSLYVWTSDGMCNFKYRGDHKHEEEVVYLPEPVDGKLGWGQCKDSEICSEGKEQSPINIVSNEVVLREDLGGLELESGSITKVGMSWTGHNQVFNFMSDASNGVSSFVHGELGGEPYELIQYHLHTPSEHTIDGVYYDAEVHLVHMNQARTQLAVIGIFVSEQRNGNESKASEFFETMIHEQNHEHEYNQSKFRDFDPTKFLEELSSLEYFNYKGSLTTPPCSEGVNWFVLKAPLFVSPDQLQRLKLYQPHNSRPVQPQNHRQVFFYPENQKQR